MAEAQEKRPTLLELWRNPSADASVRLYDELPKRASSLNERAERVLGPQRVHVETWDEDACNAAVIEALLDKLDEARAERDELRVKLTQHQDIVDSVRRSKNPDALEKTQNRAAAAEWLAAKNQSERDEARAEVERLTAQLAEARSSAEHMRRAADRVCSKAEEARAEVERQKGIVSDALERCALSRSASQREQARANAAEMRVAELEAEVERLRRECSEFSQSNVELVQQVDGLSDVIRCASAHRLDFAIWIAQELAKKEVEAPVLDGLRSRIQRVAAAMNGGAAPLPEPEDPGDQQTTDIPTWIHVLDKRVTADLNVLRDRVTALEEARNG